MHKPQFPPQKAGFGRNEVKDPKILVVSDRYNLDGKQIDGVCFYSPESLLNLVPVLSKIIIALCQGNVVFVQRSMIGVDDLIAELHDAINHTPAWASLGAGDLLSRVVPFELSNEGNWRGDLVLGLQDVHLGVRENPGVNAAMTGFIRAQAEEHAASLELQPT